MSRCPRCGSRVRPTVEHQKLDDLPEFAVPRWECISCSWRSDRPPGDKVAEKAE